MTSDIKAGDTVQQKNGMFVGHRGVVLEVSAGGALVRYEPGGPFGERGRRHGVWEHLCDLEHSAMPSRVGR